MINPIQRATLLWIMNLSLFSGMATAQTISDTQRSLQQLDQKIAVIQKDLNQTHTQQTQLQRELSTTERQIKHNELTLQALQQQIPLKKTAIEKIEKETAESQLKLTQLQALMLHQIQTRYKQQPNQPLEWFLVHPQKAEIDKILSYYHYVLRAHKQILQQMQITQAHLQSQQTQLQQEVEKLHHLQSETQIIQQQLQAHKNHHQTLLVSLQHHMLTQKNTLGQYQRNRNNLSEILGKLSRESVIQTRHSMTTMKRKLPNPVDVSPSQIHKIHQGIMLYSAEGSAVQAVYPGKVVFGEWLNGYGLLLIIDHGWGLMTLYANNHALTKHVGDIVNQGEQIALVGHGGIAKQTGLYFEVRKHGKAIPPLDWLGVPSR